MALADAELLIADGHHRYETARVYADEVGGEGEHRYVLMLLCSLSDPGLLVFPTHRLLTGLKDDTAKQLAIRDVLMRDFEIEELADVRRARAARRRPVAFGYMDSFHKQPYRVTLKDQSIADRGARGHARPLPPARHRGAGGARPARRARHVRGRHLAPAAGSTTPRTSTTPSTRSQTGRADAGFFMRATPVEQVREVAEAGESMPPKSTYFYPKVPTGLVFNPLT